MIRFLKNLLLTLDLNMPDKKNIKNTAEYGAEQIQVLKGLEPVRKRPGMYIGGTGIEGLHHLIWEIVDNAIDEAMAGYCTQIKVKILEGDIIEVTDNGRGIPVEIHPTTKKSTLETVLTVLHAGGKFGGGGYKVTGGLHGVGASVTNALSEWLKAEVLRNGKIWKQDYKRGKPTTKLKAAGKTKQTGTKITFKPDPRIFPQTVFERDIILTSLRRSAYLTKGLNIVFEDLRNPKNPFKYAFYFEGGIASYIKHLNLRKENLHDEIFYVDKEVDSIKVEIALQYTNEYQENILTFANNKNTPGGGTHLAGFKTALTRTLNHYARSKNLLKEKDENLTGDDSREGLTAVISVKILEPQFEGQTKDKLGNPEVRPAIDAVFSEALATFLEENPKTAESIFGKCQLAAKARLAARAARDSVLRKGALDGLTLPGKLADCSSKKKEKCELFIVEGDSAGGSAKQGRNREFQAILPMRGKLLNVERARLDKILGSTTLKPLIIALGTNIGEMFDIEKLRYNKIIILADADVDGSHIRTLLLTFFYRHFKPLIERGHLYIAQPPLYKLQKGKQARYAFTEREKEKFLKQMSQSKTSSPKKKKMEDNKESMEKNIDIQRYKGLGEMNPSQLWETTMDPNNRMLKQVLIRDQEKTEHMFEVLMGSDVLPRKRFISTHAKNVHNLDI